MDFRARSTRERYNELKRDPILFCKYSQNIGYKNDGLYNTGPGWQSCDSTVQLFISCSVLPENQTGRRLFIIGDQVLLNGQIDEAKDDKDDITFVVTEFIPSKSDHWCCIFTDCAYNYHSGNIKFCHMALFWALYISSWTIDEISEALKNVPNEVAQICYNYICTNLVTLSLNKQKILINILKKTNPQISPLVFPEVEEALNELSPATDFNNYGLFQKIIQR